MKPAFRPPLSPLWTAEALRTLEATRRREARQRPTARNAARNIFEARYVAAQPIEAEARLYARACLRRMGEDVSADEVGTNLLKAWRLAWQAPDDALMAMLVSATESIDGQIPDVWTVEAKVSARLLTGGPNIGAFARSLQTQTQALGMLTLPKMEACRVLDDSIGRSIRAARASQDPARALGVLGGVGWRRGIAWMRLRLDGVSLVSPALQDCFYGLNR